MFTLKIYLITKKINLSLFYTNIIMDSENPLTIQFFIPIIIQTQNLSLKI